MGAPAEIIDRFEAKAARIIGVSRQTLRKGLRVVAAAKTNPEIAAAWNKLLRGEFHGGEAAVDALFQLVVRKSEKQPERA